MKQYQMFKSKHPDAILLFRVGDFYETFGQDAIKASEILGITLTRRANGSASFVELAGFPYHALDTYLPKLVRAGQRVAICEQLEDPKLAKGIVKRGITEMVTPGVSINDHILNHRENNFLAAFYPDKNMAGVAFLDISTGEFYTAEGNFDYIDKLMQTLNPKEILYERSKKARFAELFGDQFYSYPLDEWIFNLDTATDRLQKQFETQTLKGFGIQAFNAGIVAAGAILFYLDLTSHENLKNITGISRIDQDQYVWLDKFTIRNLELFAPLNENGKALADVIDRTLSPMGSRMLKRWIALPLKNTAFINERLDIIEYLVHNREIKQQFQSHIKIIGDLERIITKVAMQRVTPRELLQLGMALNGVTEVKNLASESSCDALKRIAEQLNPCFSVRDRILAEINPECPNQLVKGGVIATGISEELDQLRQIAFSGKDFLLKIQEREILSTGINSLKISFNNVFGYYIEVRNTHKDKVPPEWIRKQTLVSAERYITPELKEYEEKILGAEEKIVSLETNLFNQLVADIGGYIEAIQLDATLIARIDCFWSLAEVAMQNNYCRPEINESLVIDICEGRHPVIEKQLPVGEPYITNDVLLDENDQQIIIVTGPNMAGKSALLRQTALIVLLAQMGSFVPAKSASISMVDKIFTRVGASDNISLGESTFMVEMNEASSILNNLSPRSLVLFDELGRGTSTYDGISIAWAIVEYIHEHPYAKAKTLFATHYHELNEMEKSFARVKNYNVSVREVGNKVIFLRKLVKGGSEHSFGIHVARMAGMPKSVVTRAEKILADFETENRKGNLAKPVDKLASHREGYQLSIFQLDDPVLKQIRDQIKNIDINNLTPVEALNKLNEIKKITGL